MRRSVAGTIHIQGRSRVPFERLSISMVESDSAPQFTSNYISTTTRPVVLAGARRASRNPPPPSPSISPTIASFTHVISESYDLPSDHYWNSELNQSSPTDLEASFEPPKNQPILKWNALCVQVLLYPITIVIYLLIGAAIFTAIERDNEKTMRQNVASQEMQRVDELQKAIEAVLRQHDISENISEEILSILCTSNSEIQNAPLQWEFLPAFYFAASVISTIGKMSLYSYIRTLCYFCYNRIWYCVATHRLGTGISLYICCDGNTIATSVPSNNWQVSFKHTGSCNVAYP